MRLIDADKGLISKIQLETGCNFITAQKIVDSMPTVEERKVGKWILIDKEKNIWKCTKCIELGKDDWWQLNSGTPTDNKMDYCPHCGAEMGGSENEIRN